MTSSDLIIKKFEVQSEVIVISDDDETIAAEDIHAAEEISSQNSPSILSPDISYHSLTNPRGSKFENRVVAASVLRIKLEPTECSSAQYLERTHPSDSADGAVYHRENQMAGNGVGTYNEENLDQAPRFESTNMKAPVIVSDGTGTDVTKCPVKKLRKRKLLTTQDNAHCSHPLLPMKRKAPPTGPSELSNSKRVCSRSALIADKSTTIGSRIINLPVTLPGISNSSAVSVIKSIDVLSSNLSNINTTHSLTDVTSTSQGGVLQTHNDEPTDSVFSQNRQDLYLGSSTQDEKSVSDFLSSDAFTSTPIKQEPSRLTSEGGSIVKRKRKLFKSVEDIDKVEDSTTTQSCVNFLDSNIILSHTKQNSRTRFCFITQLQAQGFTLPHDFILELVQDMMMSKSPSKRDTMYTILWTESERSPQTTNKDFLDQLFTTIIDSVMTTKYHHTDNANMALRYLLNIFCVDWRNSMIGTSSYIATFLLAKRRQLLCEIRRFYEKPPHLFCPCLALTLQQLLCLPLAVTHEPQRLSDFSHSVFNEVFVELSRKKQKIFLSNLSSPYLVTQLIATQLTNDYVSFESRDLLWSNHFDFIDSNWISRLLMLALPYLRDGKDDLCHMLWLLTHLLAKFVQRQRGGVVLSTPICVTNPLLAIEPDSLLNCNSIMKDFLDNLAGDEVIQKSLYTPEACYYMKLMMALIEEKTTLKNFESWL